MLDKYSITNLPSLSSHKPLVVHVLAGCICLCVHVRVGSVCHVGNHTLSNEHCLRNPRPRSHTDVLEGQQGAAAPAVSVRDPAAGAVLTDVATQGHQTQPQPHTLQGTGGPGVRPCAFRHGRANVCVGVIIQCYWPIAVFISFEQVHIMSLRWCSIWNSSNCHVIER